MNHKQIEYAVYMGKCRLVRMVGSSTFMLYRKSIMTEQWSNTGVKVHGNAAKVAIKRLKMISDDGFDYWVSP